MENPSEFFYSYVRAHSSASHLLNAMGAFDLPNRIEALTGNGWTLFRRYILR